MILCPAYGGAFLCVRHSAYLLKGVYYDCGYS